jgi:hypothetical protein
MRLTNWYTHPADNRYHVFEFHDAGMAEEFQRDLQSAGIEFEREVPVRGAEEEVARFGVHRSLFKQALKVNHLLHGRHRVPFIAHKGLRWFMLLFTAALVGLAVVGWMQS